SYMVVPVLKRIVLVGDEPDVTDDDFGVAANADIGTDDAEGVDYFYFRVVSPKRLLSFLKEDKIVNGRATFIMERFDLSLVEE
ncbi:Imm8 family immunity protein, partial [Rhizobium ruizarguesonis]